MKKIIDLKIVAVFIAMFVSATAFSAYAGQEKIAVLPFKINAKEDLSYLKDGIFDMLSSRLSSEGSVKALNKEDANSALSQIVGPVNESSVKVMGNKIGVEYVLYGSITVFGENVSLDARMVDVSGAKETVSFSGVSKGFDDVVPRINDFAADINYKIFGKGSGYQAKTTNRVESEDKSIYQHPEKLLNKGYYEGFGPSNDPFSAFVMKRGYGQTSGFWKSRNFKSKIIGMDLGDVDNDKKNEVVFISPEKIFVYRNFNKKFVKVYDMEVKGYVKLISVDVGDMNNNGVDEIYITAFNASAGKNASFVLEWNGKDLVRIASELGWYFRIQRCPKRAPVLYGQTRGRSEVFSGAVFSLVWVGGGLERGEKVRKDADISVYDFTKADFTNKKSDSILIFDDQDRMHMFDQKGRREWQSNDRYGGTENHLEQKAQKGETSRIYLPQRVIITDMDNDNRLEVLLIQSFSLSGRFFSKYRSYSGGQIIALGWNGLGMGEIWHTRKVSGHMSDITIGDFDNDGGIDAVVSVVSERGGVALLDPRSSLISYDLLPMIEQAKEMKKERDRQEAENNQ